MSFGYQTPGIYQTKNDCKSIVNLKIYEYRVKLANICRNTEMLFIYLFILVLFLSMFTASLMASFASLAT